PGGRPGHVLVQRDVERLARAEDVEPGAVVGELDTHCRPAGRAGGAADRGERGMAAHEVADVVGLVVEEAVRVLHLHRGASADPRIILSSCPVRGGNLTAAARTRPPAARTTL